MKLAAVELPRRAQKKGTKNSKPRRTRVALAAEGRSSCARPEQIAEKIVSAY
jgi:hypothetical protein